MAASRTPTLRVRVRSFQILQFIFGCCFFWNCLLYLSNMLTIKDIAREAGVSRTTVSNVIHGASSHVSAETIERINKIIKENNYTPNMYARALVNKSSRIIGVINHSISAGDGNFMMDPFHTEVIGGIERELRKRDYYMMLRTVDSEEELVSLFRNWNLDGVIITGVFEDQFYERVVKSEIPCVLLDSYIKHSSLMNVGLKDYDGAYQATKYLLEKGHKNIVFASPKIHEEGVVRERFNGYNAALKDFGVLFNQKNLYECKIDINAGRELGALIAERNDVTAVFATADMLAVGIMSGLFEKGVKIPDDISIVGFDDLYMSRITSPSLTTVHQNIVEKGELAASMLIDFIEKRDVNKNIIMSVSLVERNSVCDISCGK